MRQSVPPIDARRLLGGGPVTLVTTSWRSNINVMPAAFITPLSFEPPLVGVAVHPSRHTHDMIKYSEEFALNIPSRELLHHCQYLGSLTGRDSNKLELTKLPTFRARHVDAPLLEGCVGYIECGVEDAFTIGDHTLFVGKVVAAQVEKEAFEETWLLDDPDLKPLHYLGLNIYGLLEGRLEARIPTPVEDETIEENVDAGVDAAKDELNEQRERESAERERARREGTNGRTSAGSS
jgi:flavin reductase (DIM6/NTAB) family NADH-FMN oxidoreductase RutF